VIPSEFWFLCAENGVPDRVIWDEGGGSALEQSQGRCMGPIAGVKTGVSGGRRGFGLCRPALELRRAARIQDLLGEGISL